MAGIDIASNFSLGAALPIDDKLNLSKAQMLTINENIWPDKYFTICTDDGQLYIYNKSNIFNPETGRFRVLEGGGSGGDSIQVTDLPTPTGALVGTIFEYVGETTADYTNGYFYQCQGTSSYDGVVNFEPHKVGFDYQQHTLAEFFESWNIQNYQTITHGTMTYLQAGDLWALEGLDANEQVVFTDLKLYTGDLENGGFVFINPPGDYHDEEVIEFDILWTTVSTYSWEQKDVQPASSGATTADVTANTTVGGITSGDTIPAGTSLTDVLRKLVIIEIAPTVSFSSTNSGVREEGTSVTPTMTFTISNAGSGTPVSISFYSGSTLLDTQSYVSGTNTYTYTMETAITTNTTVKGVLNYKKSDNTDATIEKTASYTFVMASYYGAVSTAPTTSGEITALTKNVKNTKNYTATYNLSNQRSCYCYPASFGNLTSIKDANNFEYIQSYTKTNVTVDGVSYNVYTLTDPTTISSFKQVFA